MEFCNSVVPIENLPIPKNKKRIARDKATILFFLNINAITSVIAASIPVVTMMTGGGTINVATNTPIKKKIPAILKI